MAQIQPQPTLVEQGADGKPRLTLTLPDTSALDGLAQTLARLMAMGSTVKSGS